MVVVLVSAAQAAAITLSETSGRRRAILAKFVNSGVEIATNQWQKGSQHRVRRMRCAETNYAHRKPSLHHTV
jgi:uncharacterized protein with GYD domain